MGYAGRAGMAGGCIPGKVCTCPREFPRCQSFVPHKIGFHADCYGENGRQLMEGGIFGDMAKYGDFDTLDNARDYADRSIVSDSRVAYVGIRESIQEYAGCHWKAGKHVETVYRPDAIA